MYKEKNYSWNNLMKDHESYFNFADGDVEVVFLGLRERLLDFIKKSDVIVGCVAWISDPQIIKALGVHKHVSVIVTKGRQSGLHGTKGLRDLADSLRGSGLDAVCISDLYYYLDESGKKITNLDIVRCAGYVRHGSTTPLLHHKFLVRCTRTEEGLRADAVWTGSFNLTTPASEIHFENAIIVERPDIAERYRRVWEAVYLLSEPLYTKNATATELKFNDDLEGSEDYINDEMFLA